MTSSSSSALLGKLLAHAKTTVKTDLYTFTKQQNEYPDNLRFEKDLKQIAEEAEKIAAPTQQMVLWDSLQDAAVIEETRDVLLGDWFVMKRIPTNYDYLPAPRYREVAPPINMDYLVPTNTNTTPVSPRGSNADKPPLSASPRTSNADRESFGRDSEGRPSDPGESTTTRGRSSLHLSVEKNAAAERRLSDASPQYKRVPADSTDKGAKSSLLSQIGKAGAAGTQAPRRKTMFTLTNVFTLKRQNTGFTEELPKPQRGSGGHDTNNDLQTALSVTLVDDVKRSSLSERIKAGVTAQELLGVKPFLKNAEIAADYEIGEQELDRLVSICENRFQYPSYATTMQEGISDRAKNDVISPYPETKYTYTTIGAKSFSINIEPLFGRMALYDVKNMKKISEDFHFQVNKESELKLLSAKLLEKFAAATKSSIYTEPTGLFRVTEPHTEIYLVVFLDRVLQNNIEDAWKLYKEGSGKQEKLRKKVQEANVALGLVRQPFLWGTVKLFKQENNIDVIVNEGTVTIRDFYRIPSTSGGAPFDVLNALSNLDKPEQSEFLKKSLHLEAFLKLEINHATNDKLGSLRQVFDERCFKLQLPRDIRRKISEKYPYEIQLEQLFKVVEDFPIYIPTTPPMAYNNSFYVYPETADFTALSFKTIMLKISYRSSDILSEESPEPRIADHYDQSLRVPFALTCATYHQKNPQFMDEIKVELPIHVSPTSNMLIEIFSISTKASESPKLIGYSFLRIYDGHHFAQDGVHQLPVYKKLKNNYTTTFPDLDTMKEPTLTVRTKHLSSLYCQDKYSAALFSTANKAYPILNLFGNSNLQLVDKFDADVMKKVENWVKEFTSTIEVFTRSNVIEVIQFTPFIMTMLLKLLTKLQHFMVSDEEKKSVSDDTALMAMLQVKKIIPKLTQDVMKAFLAFMGRVISVTQEKDRKNIALSMYIQTFFNNFAGTKLPLYHQLLNILTSVLGELKETSVDKFRPKTEWDQAEYLARKSRNRFQIEQIDFKTLESSPMSVPADNVTLTMETQCYADVLRFFWVFFDLMSKSLNLYIARNDAKVNKAYIENDSKFVEDLVKFIHTAVPLMQKNIELKSKNYHLLENARNANIELAVFLRELVTVLPASSIITVVKAYMDDLSAEDESLTPEAQFARSLLKLEFIEIFTDFANFIPYTQANPSLNILFDELTTSAVVLIRRQPDEFQEQAVKTVKLMLARYDFDAKLQAPEIRKLIANNFFSLIQKGIPMFAELSKKFGKSDVTLDFILSVFHILRNADSAVVNNWFRDQGYIAVSAIYEVLLLSVLLLRKNTSSSVVYAMSHVGLQIFEKLMLENYLAIHSQYYIEASKKTPGKEGTPSTATSEEEKVEVMDISKIDMQEVQSKVREPASKVFDIFEKCAYLLYQILLSTPNKDSKTNATYFEQHVLTFLNNYKILFTVAEQFVQRQRVNDEMSRIYSIISDTVLVTGMSSSAYNSLLGGILMHCEMPSQENTHPIVQSCLQQLTCVFGNIEDDDSEGTITEAITDINLSDDEDEELGTSIGASVGLSAEGTSSFSLSNTLSGEIPEVSTSVGSNATPPSSGVTSKRRNRSTNSIDLGKEEEDEVIVDLKDKSLIAWATLRKLVAKMFVDERMSGGTFYKQFFLTYLSFSTPVEVIAEIKHYLMLLVSDESETEQEKNTKIYKIINMIKYWITHHFDDFNPESIASLVYFVDHNLSKVAQPKKMIKDQIIKPLLQKLLEIKDSKIAWAGDPPQIIIPKRFTPPMLNGIVKVPFNFLEWDNVEIARQCTLIDFQMYKGIQPKEIFAEKKARDTEKKLAKATNPNEDKKKKEELKRLNAPHVSAMSDRFNRFNQWVIAEVLRQTDDKKRIEVIKKFVDLGEKFRELRNFQAWNMILAALVNSAVDRLKPVWDEIPEVRKIVDKQVSFFAPPFYQLREEMEKALPPAVPFIGMYLTEAIYNVEGKDKFKEVKKGSKTIQLINFKRCYLSARTIDRIKDKQQGQYGFREIPYLHKALITEIFENGYTAEEAWKRSLEICPQAQRL